MSGRRISALSTAIAVAIAVATFGLAVPSGATGYPPNTLPREFRAIRVNGFPRVGRTVYITITGLGFYAQPKITSDEPGLTAVVTHDHGNSLVVKVTIKPGEPAGWHTFTITLANGRTCKVNFYVKQ